MKKNIVYWGMSGLIVCGLFIVLLLYYSPKPIWQVEVRGGNPAFSSPCSIAWQEIKTSDLEKLNQSLADHFTEYEIYVTSDRNSTRNIPIILLVSKFHFPISSMFTDSNCSFSDQDRVVFSKLIDQWYTKLPKKPDFE